MSRPSSLDRLGLVVGDITKLNVDAIVTAANEALAGGGGVDGAVHAAAGKQLVVASQALAPCPPGEARITQAFDLPMQFVVHAVGPIFHQLEQDSPILASAYRNSLDLASTHGVHHLAFPCISTGVYGFPKEPACEIAIETTLDWLAEHELPEKVTFCCYSEADCALYRTRLAHL